MGRSARWSGEIRRYQGSEKPLKTGDSMCDLGRLLNKDRFPPIKGPADIYEMVRELSREWKGLSLERIKKSPTGITWPSYSPDEPDTMGPLYRDNRFSYPGR